MQQPPPLLEGRKRRRATAQAGAAGLALAARPLAATVKKAPAFLSPQAATSWRPPAPGGPRGQTGAARAPAVPSGFAASLALSSCRGVPAPAVATGALVATLASLTARRFRRRAGAAAQCQRNAGRRSKGLTIEELAVKLRTDGVLVSKGKKSQKLGSLLANFVEQLETTLAEEEEEASEAPAKEPAVSPELAPSPAVATAEVPPSKEDPQSIFDKLYELDPRANKEDYFDGESGEWDVEGLNDDYKLAFSQKPAAPKDDPEHMLAYLVNSDSRITKADYFDEDENAWDLEGLQEDYKLAKAKEPSIAADPPKVEAAPEAKGPAEAEALWEQLSKMDVKASKEDYYDAEGDEWDLGGLKDDLALAQKKSEAATATAQPAAKEDPESLMAELLQLAPSSSKEDYFDEDSNSWDVEGLRDDLVLARGKQAKLIGVGDYVLAKYEEEGWYTAAVEKDNGDGTLQLKWDEDSTATPVSKDLIVALPPVAVDAHVSAIWAEDGGWYSGVVQKANPDGTFVVKYDEDQSEATLPKEKIRMKVEPPKEPTYWAAPYREGAAPPEPGAKVNAMWREGDYEGYHPAVVMKDNGDGTFLLKWGEDDTESSVKKEEIRTFELRNTFSDLTVGQKVTGIVVSLTTFGAFVDFGSERTGLVHISKLAERRIDNVEDIVQLDQVVDAWVASVDGAPGEQKVGLTMVQGLTAQSKQRNDVTPFMDSGDTWLKGRVVNIKPFGVFVAVTPPNGGQECTGFVHVSEIRDGFIEDIEQEDISLGQEVHVLVKGVDVENQKLSLTMKGH